MNFRKQTSRWALWVFAAALLLKAAMPVLASASAQMQGKTLVEVCTVYGVSMVPLGPSSHDPATDHVADHSGEHCALTALAALASVGSPRLAPVPVALHDGSPPVAQASSEAPDACATWVARLKHGPPALA